VVLGLAADGLQWRLTSLPAQVLRAVDRTGPEGWKLSRVEPSGELDGSDFVVT
jgi:hypothetical protein